MRTIIPLNSLASLGTVRAHALVRLAVLAATLCGTQMLAAQVPANAAPSATAHKPAHPHKRPAAAPKQPPALPATPPALMPRAPQTIAIKDAVELHAYQTASAQRNPKAKVEALESFLRTYPQSVAKSVVLDQLLDTYAEPDAYAEQQNRDRMLSAANRLLRADPSNLKAIFSSVFIERGQCSKMHNAHTCDDAAALAQRGLSAAKTADYSDDDWKKLTGAIYPVFHSAIALDDILSKKDVNAGISEYRTELMLYTNDQSKTAGLNDTLQLAELYSKPDSRDLLQAVWLYARAWDYAPPAYKTRIETNLEYYYKESHGGLDGLDAFKTQAAATTFPPGTLGSTPPVTPPAPELPHWPVNEKPDQASVTWDSQGLRIDAANSSLQQILKDVSTATGVKVEGMGSDERIFGAYGPGQARDVLSQLLQGSGYNVLMIGDQGQGTPRQIVLTARKTGGLEPAKAGQATTPEEDAEAEDQPQQGEPKPANPPYRPNFGPGGPHRNQPQDNPQTQRPPQ